MARRFTQREDAKLIEGAIAPLRAKIAQLEAKLDQLEGERKLFEVTEHRARCYLTVLDHRDFLSEKGLRPLPKPAVPGIVIIASRQKELSPYKSPVMIGSVVSPGHDRIEV